MAIHETDRRRGERASVQSENQHRSKNVRNRSIERMSVFLVVAAFAFVVANVASAFRLVCTTIFPFAMAFGVEAFLVRTGVVTRVCHTIGDMLVCRRL